MKTLIFDTETTGLPKNSIQPLDRQPRIIEFFGLSYDSELESTSSVHFLFNPGIKLDKKIIEITHITDDMLKDKPFFKSKSDYLVKLIEDHDEVVAHNAAFDMAMVDFEMKRLHKEILWPKAICTVESTEYLKGHRIKLMDLHETLFGEKFNDAHRAENDVMALFRCFKQLRSMGVL